MRVKRDRRGGKRPRVSRTMGSAGSKRGVGPGVSSCVSSIWFWFMLRTGERGEGAVTRAVRWGAGPRRGFCLEGAVGSGTRGEGVTGKLSPMNNGPCLLDIQGGDQDAVAVLLT